MKEPIWLKRLYIEAFHEDQLRINGGLDGERDPAALDAALARPLYLFQYKKADLCALAACYAHGITKSHAFNDGNKRAAFAAAVVFLDMNGLELTLTEPEATKAMEDLTCPRAPKLTVTRQDDSLRQNDCYQLGTLFLVNRLERRRPAVVALGASHSRSFGFVFM